MTTKTDTDHSTPATTETYAAAYSRLAAIAEKLRTGGQNAGVDDIVDDLRAARKMYAICKSRLDAIRREVDLELEAADDAAGG